jgi:hypothetical protein
MNFLQQTETTPIYNQGFPAYLNSLPQWERELLTHVTLLDNPTDIIADLNAGSFTIGSDGSVIADSASFGYVLSGPTKRRLIRGHGPAPASEGLVYGCQYPI